MYSGADAWDQAFAVVMVRQQNAIASLLSKIEQYKRDIDEFALAQQKYPTLKAHTIYLI